MALNKFLMLLPLMLAARKLDGDNPKTVLIIRLIYFSVQAVIVVLVVYLYFQSKSLFRSQQLNVSIYIPSPSQPFADKNSKQQFKEVKLTEHIISLARSLLASTLFGLMLTSGLHFYKGVIIGLSMQTIMSPLNLFENTLTKIFILKRGTRITDLEGLKLILGFKFREELTINDVVVDERGNVVNIEESFDSGRKKSREKDFEDILLDTWDEGSKADMKSFLDSVKKKNVNTALRNSGWTPIMIIAAIGVKETVEVLEKLKRIGADPAIVDGEGWNALHWAAFHSSVDGAKFLLSPSGFDGVTIGLHLAKDKEGKTPLDLATDENNMDVAKIIENAASLGKNDLN